MTTPNPAASRLGCLAAWLAAALSWLAAALPGQAAVVPEDAVEQTAAAACPDAVRVAAAESPLRWRAEPGLEGTARALARDPSSLAPLPGLGDPRLLFPEPPTAWVVARLDCLEAYGLAGAPADWVAGLASVEENFLVVRAGGGDPASLRSVLRHEVAHLALAAATGNRAPRWLQEGYAQYASGSWDWREAWRLRFVLFLGGEDRLESLSTGFPRDAERAGVAYLLSYTAVHELASIGEPDALAAFFRAMGEGEGVDGAMRRVYGLTLDRFEERWRDRVGARYGWLYVLSRASVFWVGITLLLLWVGWRRRRHDRRRLEALREAEHRAERAGEQIEPWREGGWRPGRPPRGLP